MQKDKILLTGALGQIGSELSQTLRDVYGEANVVVSDIRRPADLTIDEVIFEEINVLDTQRLGEVIAKYKITQIYHLAAVLSASGEQDPLFAWQINMDGTLNVLDAAREFSLHKVYFPSSIAVFGKDTPKHNTPQHTIMNPSTIYGISKLTGERWCEYYFRKYGLDVRSLRYPGIISYKTPPGGGTTDYAVDIYYKAAEGKKFECFLKENTYLPMMYMPDAIKATLDIMNAPAEKVKIRSSYNITAMSFSPKEVYQTIQKQVSDFKISYKPDFRQEIADSWPASIDDSVARQDWDWQPDFDLSKMTDDMLINLRKLKEVLV
ncbi:MAG: NAD-dependent epimerase/dehydratase family protein [Microscillaceae bacterium]|jgi:nucleoside-diphosphate-sugar epimerase|nr:NAD-dependent epimerase/dehydratase family protein [Microscillaceae bacterium]